MMHGSTKGNAAKENICGRVNGRNPRVSHFQRCFYDHGALS